ncbi:MAG: PilW family protein [Gammaproteobacteria bacterium]|nr:PilW family protein [Gammaproteobacteria bacterium]
MSLSKQFIQNPVPDLQHGLSLIEMMVALAVSAILLLGVTTVYTSSKRSYQVTEEFSDIQENARFALHFLSRNIRMAGFTGCSSLKSMSANNTTGNDNYKFEDETSITGFAAASAEGVPDGGTPVGTAAISIRKATACSAQVTGTTNGNKTVQFTNSNCNFAQNDLVIVTDCESADIFQNNNNPQGAANADDPNQSGPGSLTSTAGLSKSYGSSAYVFKFENLSYFLMNDATNGNRPTLYKTENGTTEALVPNVEDLAIKYGVDTNGDNSVDTIRDDAAAVGANNWNTVLNVYIHLLVRSDPVGDGTNGFPFSFNGTVHNSANDNLINDGRYRKEFVTSIALRNRIP